MLDLEGCAARVDGVQRLCGVRGLGGGDLEIDEPVSRSVLVIAIHETTEALLPMLVGLAVGHPISQNRLGNSQLADRETPCRRTRMHCIQILEGVDEDREDDLDWCQSDVVGPHRSQVRPLHGDNYTDCRRPRAPGAEATGGHVGRVNNREGASRFGRTDLLVLI